MVFLPSVLIAAKDPAKKLDGPTINKLNAAILGSLRDRPSDKYLIGINTSATIRQAYKTSGLAKDGYSPLMFPSDAYTLQDAAAYGKALDVPYVAFLIHAALDFPLLKGFGGGLGTGYIPADLNIVCMMVDVATGKPLPAGIVRVKGTKEAKAVELERELINAKPTPDTLPTVLGTCLAGKLHDEIEKAPFKS